MSSFHVTLKAGVIYTQCALVHTRVRVLYRVRNAQSAFHTWVGPYLYQVRNAQSAFYTWVHVLYPVRSPQSVFYTDRIRF